MPDANHSGPCLEAVGVSKRLAGRQVLDRVSLRVEGGEVVGLLGPNGAGKSTLFRILMGLLTPETGEVLLDGRNITRLPTYRRARLGLGYLPQEPSAFLGLSAQANLEAVLELAGRPRSEAGAWLGALDLAGRSRQRAATLSGGERRRLEIARLLVTRPRLLLLDEPLRGLDPGGLDRLRQSIEQVVAQGSGVLLTDHPVEMTLGVCQRLYLLAEGRIIASGSPEEVAAHPLAQRVYFGQPPRLGDAFSSPADG